MLRIIVLAYCGIVACGRTPATSATVIPAYGVSEGVRPIPVASLDTFKTRRRLVIRDSSTWEKVLAAMPRGTSPPPAIDFAKEVVILVGTRTFTGTGPFIRIDSVGLRGQELTAYVRTASCAGPAFGGHMMTTPVEAVAVPRKYKKVVFAESYEADPGCFDGRPDTTA